jgi:UDP-3-O-[3-hydroxymyristoyl] glucosamine N-acyltransferase
MTLITASYSLEYLSDRVHGKILGDKNQTITGLCTLDEPQKDHIAFIRAKGPNAISKALRSFKGSAAFVLVDDFPMDLDLGGTSVVLVSDPYAAFLDTISLFHKEECVPAGIHPTALVDPTATIDATASIGAFCLVGPNVSIGARVVLESNVRVLADAQIGEDVVLHSGVVVRERCVIGRQCIIHDNTVIGADGFGYAPDKVLGLRKVPQLGSVKIAERVEIGANSCVDRGALGDTTIGMGTKIDNLVQIGHNVTIGRFCIICGQVGIAGSTVIEDGVVLSGQVGVSDHRRLVSGVRVGGGAPVTEDITEPGDYFGHPLLKAREWHRHQTELRLKMKRRSKSQSGA